MRVLDLFSGIGGFSLGLERAGMETVAFCETDSYCQKILKKHWPGVPVYDDVRSLNYDGAVDLICGGYPCQPFSVAGKRKGVEDDRHLWPAMFSLIQKYRPAWVIGENVAGHVSMGLDSVLADMESENYICRTFIIPACAVGAYHRRDRVWIVAHAQGSDDQGRPRELQGQDEQQTQERQKKRSAEPSCSSKNVADADSKRLSSAIPGKQRSVSKTTRTQQRGQLSGRNAETRRTWPPEPNVGRVADGVPNRVDRLRALGNAVVPQIPEMIGRAIMGSHHTFPAPCGVMGRHPGG